MNAKKFSDAMSELDTKYVDEALNYKNENKKKAYMDKVGELWQPVFPKKPLNGLSGIIRYRQKNNLLSIQFQPSYMLMTVLERLTADRK